jgi:hypothetical protein
MTITTTIEKRWADLSARAQAHIRATRPHLLRLWDCIDGDAGCVNMVEADTAKDAIRLFASTYDRDMYDVDPNETIYVDISVRNWVTGEEEERTLKLAPVEPPCSGGQSHDWRSPRGLAGVYPSWGAGVRIVEVCAHCGIYAELLTESQRRDTGEYAGARVSYQPADDDSLAWVRSQRRSAKR